MSSVLETPSEILPLSEVEQKFPLPKRTTDQNGNPVIYTGPTYTYDPNRKTAPGSRLRIQKDGTVSYSNPNAIKYAAPGSKPFKLAALKPRNDGAAETFERLKASIEKRASKVPNNNFDKYAGRPVFGNWRIVCSDGKTMLLERGEGTGERCNIYDIWQSKARLVASIDNPEFHLALKRARIMADDRTRKIRFKASPGELKLSSYHDEPYGQRGGNDAGEFEETLEINTCEHWKVALDFDFIEPLCGAWPLSVWFQGEAFPVMFESPDESWRLVVMPINEDWERFKENNEQADAEISNGTNQNAEPEQEIRTPEVLEWKTSAEYQEAIADHGKALAVYLPVRDAFRAGNIREGEYLEARALYMGAAAAFDLAFMKEQNSNLSDQKQKLEPEPPAECVHEWDDLTMSELPACIRCGKDCPDELIPKFKFLGLSVNTDEQTVHYDYLLARNEEHALELLAELRSDCIPVAVFTSKELLEFADEVIRRPADEIAADMAKLQTEAQS